MSEEDLLFHLWYDYCSVYIVLTSIPGARPLCIMVTLYKTET